MKKIKLKKKRKHKYRILIYIFLVFLSYQLSYNIIMNIKLARTNEKFLKSLLVDSNYHLLYEKKANNILSKIFSYILDINEPVKILENTFHYKANKINNIGYISNPIEQEVIEASKEEKEEPEIYIYNTHQGEQYQGKGLEEYNITPGVMMASYIFQDKLAKQNIKTLVLEDNIIDYMNLNNMKHSQSYKASRHFITSTIQNNPTLKLIIDLHRDSINKEKSTAIINDKACAKIVFVVGSEYDTYEENLKLTNQLNEKIKEKYPDISRGVMIKGGAGNNGIYNQDLSPKIILLELGSDTNNIGEVLNTIELIAPIIGEYIHG